MDEIEWWEFESVEEMAEQVAGDICFVIERAVEAHGNARIAVPVENVPEPIYAALLAKKVDWSMVTVIPTDDRLVPLGDDRSNYAKLERLFAAKGANLISLIDESVIGDYAEAGRLADAGLALLEWPLDLVCLSVGADGHTAAMFPGPDLDRAVAGPKERRAVGVRPDPMPADAPGERVTLTGAALASARTMMIVVTGDEPRSVLEQAIQEGPLSSKPIGRVLAEMDVPIDIFWSA